jgi:hypothetical protein
MSASKSNGSSGRNKRCRTDVLSPAAEEKWRQMLRDELQRFLTRVLVRVLIGAGSLLLAVAVSLLANWLWAYFSGR